MSAEDIITQESPTVLVSPLVYAKNHISEMLWHNREVAESFLMDPFGFIEAYSYLSLSEPEVDELVRPVIYTSELLNISEEIVERLLPNAKAVVQIGSLSWGKYYSVREDSDLDLEIITEDSDFEIIPELELLFPTLRVGLDNFATLYKTGQADYYSFKANYVGKAISLHFTPAGTFLRNMNLNCNTLEKTVTNLEFRSEPKRKAPIYNERYDSCGNEFVYIALPEPIPEGQLTKTPVMMVEGGKLVMGLVASKYFAFPTVYGDYEFFNKNVSNFKSNLARRVQAEGGDFSLMPARKHRMPRHLLEKLSDEFNFLLKR